MDGSMSGESGRLVACGGVRTANRHCLVLPSLGMPRSHPSELVRARLVPPRDGERDPSPHWGGFVRFSRKEGLTEGPERTLDLLVGWLCFEFWDDTEYVRS